MIRVKFTHTYQELISIDNLLLAWKEFITGKKKRKDVQEFERDLMGNIISLHQELVAGQYQHSSYEAFNISDPKPRKIHKANVRDRLLHHAVYRLLYPFFERTFISDSFSCRLGKGTHKAMERFRRFGYQVSRNHTRTCWVLKCDIRKFFENINHGILIDILERYIPDPDIMALLKNVIGSFSSGRGRGLPLGNLTSQLLVNIYMNEFDQWMKHHMKATHYIRYADDFVILYHDKAWLEELLPKLADYLEENLKLQVHPNKIFLKTLASGVDFLGWVHFPDHRVLRTVSKRRMFKKLAKDDRQEVIASYRGLLSHGNATRLQAIISEADSSGRLSAGG